MPRYARNGDVSLAYDVFGDRRWRDLVEEHESVGSVGA
jgi:hypothetical protein